MISIGTGKEMRCPNCREQMAYSAIYKTKEDLIEYETECRMCGAKYAGVLIKT